MVGGHLSPEHQQYPRRCRRVTVLGKFAYKSYVPVFALALPAMSKLFICL